MNSPEASPPLLFSSPVWGGHHANWLPSPRVVAPFSAAPPMRKLVPEVVIVQPRRLFADDDDATSSEMSSSDPLDASSAHTIRSTARLALSLKENASPFVEVTSKDKQAQVVKKRHVAFSSRPLESIHSSPSRISSSDPYCDRPFKKLKIYSDASPTQKGRLVSPPPGSDDTEDEWMGLTDDEAESQVVEVLLLAPASSASASSSPIPTKRPTPRPILKRASHPIMTAKTADEATKANAGRRRHYLSLAKQHNKLNPFVPDTQAPTQQLLAPLSLATNHTAAVSNAAAGPSRNRVPSTRSKTTTGLSKQTTGRDDSRPHRQQESDDSDPADPKDAPGDVTVSPAEDADRLRSILKILRGSLRDNGYTPESDAAVKDTPGRPLLPRPNPKGRHQHRQAEKAAESAFVLSVPVLLAEVEEAYVALLFYLLHLPPTLDNAEAQHAPLREFEEPLTLCLERDVLNVTVPMERSLVDDIFTDDDQLQPGAREGLTTAQMRRRTDETGVAQAAIKCIATLSLRADVRAVVGDATLKRLYEAVISVPRVPDLPTSVSKNVFGFVGWFIAQQALDERVFDSALTSDTFATILQLLSTPDKYRLNTSEGLAALAKLIKLRPSFVLERHGLWTKDAFEALCRPPKKAPATKQRAALALDAFVKACNGAPEGDERDRANQIADEVADVFLTYLHDAKIEENQTATSLARLCSGISTALTGAYNADEASWALNAIALLPVLLRQRFRHLSVNGIGDWVSALTDARRHPQPVVDTCAYLAWPHLVWAFLMTELSLPTAQSTSTSSRPATFLYRRNRKVISCITQVFANPQNARPTFNSDKAMVEVQAFIECAAALVRFTAREQRAQQPNYSSLDFVWQHVLQDHLPIFLTSSHESVVKLAWQFVNALLTPPPPPQSFLLIAPSLLNSFFLDGSLVNGRTPTNGAVVIRRARAKVGQMDSIIGLPSEWVANHVEQILACLEKGFSHSAVRTSADARALVDASLAKLLAVLDRTDIAIDDGQRSGGRRAVESLAAQLGPAPVAPASDEPVEESPTPDVQLAAPSLPPAAQALPTSAQTSAAEVTKSDERHRTSDEVRAMEADVSDLRTTSPVRVARLAANRSPSLRAPGPETQAQAQAQVQTIDETTESEREQAQLKLTGRRSDLPVLQVIDTPDEIVPDSALLTRPTNPGPHALLSPLPIASPSLPPAEPPSSQPEEAIPETFVAQTIVEETAESAPPASAAPSVPVRDRPLRRKRKASEPPLTDPNSTVSNEGNSRRLRRRTHVESVPQAIAPAKDDLPNAASARAQPDKATAIEDDVDFVQETPFTADEDPAAAVPAVESAHVEAQPGPAPETTTTTTRKTKRPLARADKKGKGKAARRTDVVPPVVPGTPLHARRAHVDLGDGESRRGNDSGESSPVSSDTEQAFDKVARLSETKVARLFKQKPSAREWLGRMTSYFGGLYAGPDEGGEGEGEGEAEAGPSTSIARRLS